MRRFEIKDQFYLNHVPFKIKSGSIHYFRVVPEYWRDRLEKLKAMGCNTVETYIPWNMHEMNKGEFCFTGMLDIVKFVKLAEELGLYVILRPSPYICAEWEFGGLPAWLLAEDGMRVRCSYPPYLKHVKEYYEVLIPILTPLQITEGGPVIMMQIENEYGYFGDDTAYLESLKQMMVELGVEVPFVTSDGPWGDALECGTLEGVLQTANFGSKTKEQFAVLESKGVQPLMCMEFWVGWFDHWGIEKHQTTDVKKCKEELEVMLEMGNVNIYMFQGGTNFAFMNGSNYYNELTPDVTSYDYDAVLTEDGQITEKYKAFKEVISQYVEPVEVEYSTEIKRRSYGVLEVSQKVSLENVLEDLTTKTKSPFPLSMEKVGQNYGYIMYRSVLKKEQRLEKIQLYGANDRVVIMLDGKIEVILYDTELLKEYVFESPIEIKKEAVIDILVENMGRVNFGFMMNKQRKGIDEAVLINGHQHFNWQIYSLPLNNVSKIDFGKGYVHKVPGFYRFTFQVEEVADTFLDFEGWGKGCAFINGFNLGRYWEKGPQKRLYIPGPLLKQGKNEIILFETDGKAHHQILLTDKSDLG